MKNKILFAVLMFAVVSHAQFSVGAYGLLNSSNISGDAPSGTKFTSVTGLGGGIMLDYEFNDEVTFSLQASFSPKGTVISYDLPSYEQPRDSITASVNYFTVPIMLKFTAGKVAYVTGGVELAYLSNASAEYANISGKEDVTERIAEFDFLINFGVGFVFDIGDNYSLFFEGRYSQGVVNGCRNPEHPGGSIPPDFKNSSTQLLAGIIYDF